jgi:hypothetical protein
MFFSRRRTTPTLEFDADEAVVDVVGLDDVEKEIAVERLR